METELLEFNFNRPNLRRLTFYESLHFLAKIFMPFQIVIHRILKCQLYNKYCSRTIMTLIYSIVFRVHEFVRTIWKGLELGRKWCSKIHFCLRWLLYWKVCGLHCYVLLLYRLFLLHQITKGIYILDTWSAIPTVRTPALRGICHQTIIKERNITLIQP